MTAIIIASRSCRGPRSRGTACRRKPSAWWRSRRCLPPRVLVPAEIGTGIPWALAIFVGGMLSLTTVISTYKINVWLGSYIVPAVQPFVEQPASAGRRAQCCAVATMRFVDPVGFITIAAFFLPLVGVHCRARRAPARADRDHRSAGPRLLVQLPEHLDRDDRRHHEEEVPTPMPTAIKLATAFFGVTIVALWIGVATGASIGLL